MRGVLRYAQNDKQKRGNDNSSECWVGDGFTPTNRKCAMDGAPVCCGFPKRNKDNSKFLPGMTTRKTKTKAKERPEQDKRDGNINSKGALGTVRRSRPSRKRFCVLVYLGMRVKFWMETFAPTRARSLADRKTMVISLNRWIVVCRGMGNRSTSSTGGRFRGV
jgi:hypothetical protein